MFSFIRNIFSTNTEDASLKEDANQISNRVPYNHYRLPGEFGGATLDIYVFPAPAASDENVIVDFKLDNGHAKLRVHIDDTDINIMPIVGAAEIVKFIPDIREINFTLYFKPNAVLAGWELRNGLLYVNIESYS